MMKPKLPPLPPVSPAHPPRVERFALSSGLPVYLVERHALPIVELVLMLRAGADADLPGQEGCARLTSALLSEGTLRRDGRAFGDAVDTLGASFESHAGWDESSLSLHVLRERLEPALELFTEAVAEPAFAESAFAQQQRERLASLLQERSDPRALAGRAFAEIAYPPAHRYAQPLGGGERSVAALDTSALRAHYARWYSPANGFLVVVGDVDRAALEPLLERTLAQWRPAAGASAQGVADAGPMERAVLLVPRPGAAQSELRVGHASVPRSTPDYFPLLVMNSILGGAFTSRINIRLREEKGYTYGASSGFAFRRGPGPFLVSTAVDAAATADAVADILAELERIRAEPVSATELERAKRYLALGLGRAFETTAGVAEHIAEQVRHELGDDYFDRYVERLEAVDIDAVQRVASRYLTPERAAIAVVGPSDATESLRACTGGHIVVRASSES